MRIFSKISLLALLVLSFAPLASAEILTTPHYELQDPNFEQISGNSTTTNYQVETNVPLVSAGYASTSNYRLYGGFTELGDIPATPVAAVTPGQGGSGPTGSSEAVSAEVQASAIETLTDALQNLVEELQIFFGFNVGTEAGPLAGSGFGDSTGGSGSAFETTHPDYMGSAGVNDLLRPSSDNIYMQKEFQRLTSARVAMTMLSFFLIVGLVLYFFLVR